MKKFIALALAATVAAPVFASTNVGVSIGINQPGAYGRIDIGNYPQPAVVYAQPVIIAPPPVAIERRPIYLYVPPAHQHDWRRYCGRYQACGQPVYFVRTPAYGHADWGPGPGRAYERGDDRRDERRDERRGDGGDRDWRDQRGHGGRDHGRGHGRGD
jgi:hypothetical protein